VRAVPRLCGLYPGICLTAQEKARKTLSFADFVDTQETKRTQQWLHLMMSNFTTFLYRSVNAAKVYYLGIQNHTDMP
jgi:hypothetical protein